MGILTDNRQIFPCTFVYDKTLNKIGCAILQPLFGGNITNTNLINFNTDAWLLAPTPNLKLFSVDNQETLEKVIKMTNELNKKS